MTFSLSVDRTYFLEKKAAGDRRQETDKFKFSRSKKREMTRNGNSNPGEKFRIRIADYAVWKLT